MCARLTEHHTLNIYDHFLARCLRLDRALAILEPRGCEAFSQTAHYSIAGCRTLAHELASHLKYQCTFEQAKRMHSIPLRREQTMSFGQPQETRFFHQISQSLPTLLAIVGEPGASTDVFASCWRTLYPQYKEFESAPRASGEPERSDAAAELGRSHRAAGQIIVQLKLWSDSDAERPSLAEALTTFLERESYDTQLIDRVAVVHLVRSVSGREPEWVPAGGRLIPVVTAEDLSQDSESAPDFGTIAIGAMHIFVEAFGARGRESPRSSPSSLFSRASRTLCFTRLGALTSRIADNPPSRTGIDLLVVAHVIETTVPFIEALASVYNIIRVFAVPYSADTGAIAHLRNSFPVSLPNSADEIAPELAATCFDLLARSGRPLLIYDVGGYGVSIAESESVRSSSLLGIVEDTNQGHWKYEKARQLHVPVVSIAQSRLKDLENTFIGHAVVHALENMLRSEFYRPLGAQHVLLLGYGKIGRAAATVLRGRGARVSVFDPNPVARAQARIDGFSVGSKTHLLAAADVVLGVSGHLSLSAEDAAHCRDGAILASGSSRTVEFDLPGIAAASARQQRISNVVQLYHLRGESRLYLLYSGQPINFLYGSSLGNVLDAVFCSLYECGRLLESKWFQAGIHSIPKDTEETVLASWETTHGELVD